MRAWRGGGTRSLRKVLVSGIDAGISHCWEGLDLLVLGGGRRRESLAPPRWAPSLPSCTLEGLSRRDGAQAGERLPDQGGEWDLMVPWGCVPRSCASGPHGMASRPLRGGVARHRAGGGGRGAPATVVPGVQRGREPPRGWDWVAWGHLAWLPAPWGTGVLCRILPVPAVPLRSLSAPPAPVLYGCPRGASDVPCRAPLDAEVAVPGHHRERDGTLGPSGLC